MDIIATWLAFNDSSTNPLSFIFRTPSLAPAYVMTLPTPMEQTPGGYQYVYDYIINWGDGTGDFHITTWDDPETIHTFATPGVHKIVITGLCEAIKVDNNPFPIRTITQWGNLGWIDVNFQGCNILNSIPDDLLGAFTLVRYFTNTFSGCSSLQVIPDNLFSQAWNARSFDNTFASTAIQSIPSGLFSMCPLTISMNWTFSFCTLLTSVPGSLFSGLTNVDSYQGTFFGDMRLATIGSGLFDDAGSVTDMMAVFNSCTLLTTLPSGLFDACVSVESFSGSLSATGLTSAGIPADLFDNCGAVLNLSQLFLDCASLDTVPAGLFDGCPLVTTFSATFQTSGIVGIPADLFINNTLVTTFNGTFANCANLIELPVGIFDTNILVTNFGQLLNYTPAFTTLPAALFANNVLATDFSTAIRTMGPGLTTIPADLFPVSALTVNFGSTFDENPGLTAIPATLFDGIPNVSSFNSTFGLTMGPNQILGALPTLWTRVPLTANHGNCFHGRLSASNGAAANVAGWV